METTKRSRHGIALPIAILGAMATSACGNGNDAPLPGAPTITPTSASTHSSASPESTSPSPSITSRSAESHSAASKSSSATSPRKSSPVASQASKRASSAPSKAKASKTPATKPSFITRTYTYTITHPPKASTPAPRTSKQPSTTSRSATALPPIASPTSIAPGATENAGASRGGFRDDVMGTLASADVVPCGGLWKYQEGEGKIYYARELNCPGSLRYFPLSEGKANITLGGKRCNYRGSQDLDYTKDSLDSVKWLGNTIVQICIPAGSGSAPGAVRLFNFNCT